MAGLDGLAKKITAQSDEYKCSNCGSTETFAAEHYQTAWFNVVCCEQCHKWQYLD